MYSLKRVFLLDANTSSPSGEGALGNQTEVMDGGRVSLACSMGGKKKSVAKQLLLGRDLDDAFKERFSQTTIGSDEGVNGENPLTDFLSPMYKFTTGSFRVQFRVFVCDPSRVSSCSSPSQHPLFSSCCVKVN